MARGWESKEIESQIEAAEERALASQRLKLSAEQAQHQREVESLELSRTRVLQDLETAQNPKYRAMLQQSLTFLDQKLESVKRPPDVATE
jgi:hypothetical protein